ncbi:MAG: hypothetical protein A2V65_02395 [Deltaproteobacteria bacterium RBG_13_49_15]|nr:MAG: hypothetical protein A2V65_02395 [Deltaproteobacteria bacterium RBG_13_49_15]
MSIVLSGVVGVFFSKMILLINAIISCINYDGFVKSPPAALRCIPCPVECRFAALLRRIQQGKSLRRTSQVRLIPQDLRALHLKLFSLPSQFRFFMDSSIISKYRNWKYGKGDAKR